MIAVESCRRRWLTGLLSLWTWSLAQAHEMHLSTGEAAFNRATGKLEVSLSVYLDDLELALIRRTERLMRFHSTPEVEFDATLREYLMQGFQVLDRQGQRAALHWVGHKLDPSRDDPSLMVFFEVSLPEGTQGVLLCHTLLQELFADQRNLLQVREGDRKTQLSFGRDRPQQPLSGRP